VALNFCSILQFPFCQTQKCKFSVHKSSMQDKITHDCILLLVWIYSYQHTVRKYTTQREIISKIDLTGFFLRHLGMVVTIVCNDTRMIVTSEKSWIATVKYLFYNTEKLSQILFYNIQEKFFELFLPARNSETFKFVHLLALVTFNVPYFHYIIQTIGHVSIPKRHSFSPFRFVHTIAQFSRILRCSLIYCLIFRIVPLWTENRRWKNSEDDSTANERW
jgi:hypothetical protein